MRDSVLDGKRMYHIDRLKVIGLLLVILAHVDLPSWLLQIRSFDVPLLVFVSAYLAGKSYHVGNVGNYYKKRFLRLAVPAWIFSGFFWVVQSFILTPPTIDDIIKGLMFQRDTYMLGMLWVVWVYIVCALIIPMIDKMQYRIISNVMIVFAVILFQILCSVTTLSENRFLYCTFFTVVPYGFIAWLGYYYEDMSERMKRGIIGGSALLFGVITIVLYIQEKALFPISEYKYPAQIYYLSYGILVTFLVFSWIKYFNKYKISYIVEFIGRSSFWIYLWHILVLYAVKMFIEDEYYWWLQYILVVVVSVLITWLQNKIVDQILLRFEWKVFKVFKG